MVLVVFIGGVTSAEISALRFLSAQVSLLSLNRVIFPSPRWKTRYEEGTQKINYNVILLQEGMAYDIIVATTKIVNGSTLTETFVEKLG